MLHNSQEKNKKILKKYKKIDNDNLRLVVFALGIILQHKAIFAKDLSRELQIQDGGRLRSYVDILVNHHIVDTQGRGKGLKYSINPAFVSKTRMQFETTLKTIEPYRLKALIHEDLRYHPNSTMSEISKRLPDVEYIELEKMVRMMVKDGKIIPLGGRKYRRYTLAENSFLSESGRK